MNSNASPSHSPRLSPAGSPLMMRRTGSPATPLRQGTSGTSKPMSSGSTIQVSTSRKILFHGETALCKIIKFQGETAD